MGRHSAGYYKLLPLLTDLLSLIFKLYVIPGNFYNTPAKTDLRLNSYTNKTPFEMNAPANNRIKLLFLVDSEKKNILWLTKYFENENYYSSGLGMNSLLKDRTVSWRRAILYLKYMKLAIQAIQKSNKSDIIISWNFIVGAFTAFFCRTFFIRRTILSLNMISHEKGLINKLLRKIIYNSAFKLPGFYISVNSKELINTYSAEYNINANHFFVLPDCMKESYETAPYTNGNGSVFCGGEAKRDWNTLFKAALLLPDVKFTAIARKKYFDTTLAVPDNVSLYFDTEYDFFYSKLKESSIVAMPLSTTAPAGLIVLIRAAMLSKPVIITSTSSTRNYIQDKINGVLIDPGDEKRLAEEISSLLSDRQVREQLSNRMKETVKMFSPENYAKSLENIISQIK